MGWDYIKRTQTFRDKKGWSNAKGLMAKLLVGKTHITEKMTEIDGVWKTIDESKFGMYFASKNPEADYKAALAQLAKLEGLKPKIQEISKLAEAVKKKYGSKLPSGGKQFLDKLTEECGRYERVVQGARTDEVENYKKAHAQAMAKVVG